MTRKSSRKADARRAWYSIPLDDDYYDRTLAYPRKHAAYHRHPESERGITDSEPHGTGVIRVRRANLPRGFAQ